MYNFRKNTHQQDKKYFMGISCNSFQHLKHFYMEELKFPHSSSGVPEEISSDWSYIMRRQMQEIIPSLFLGPYASANKSQLDNLLLKGITHIVCVRQADDSVYIRQNFPEKFQYLGLIIADKVTENIIQHLPQVKLFLDVCFAQGGKALVHGTNGISRSATLVIGYIMEKYCASFQDAFSLVRSRRFCVNPNEGFIEQLKEYEPIYRARLIVQTTGPSAAAPNAAPVSALKRKYDEEDPGPLERMD